jgi:hypothetical protein
MSSRSRLADALERIADGQERLADRLDEIVKRLDDPNHGLAAMKTKLGMVTDDHDAALEDHGRRLRVLESSSNGSG